MKRVRPYGTHPDVPDHRDLRWEAPRHVRRALPAAVDLRPGCPPVEDQRPLNACSAHAIGAGLLIAEIQTPSDTTYRAFDWNRTDDAGQTRTLHIDEALESIHFDVTAEHLPATTLGRLVDCAYFKVDKGHRAAGCQLLLKEGQMRTLVVLSGGGSIVSAQTEPVEFVAGDCLVIPAAYDGAIRFSPETTYLIVTL